MKLAGGPGRGGMGGGGGGMAGIKAETRTADSLKRSSRGVEEKKDESFERRGGERRKEIFLLLFEVGGYRKEKLLI